LKTGLSDFFVLPSDDPKARSIEPNYLRPFVTQSLELYSNHISSSRSTAQLFVCHTSKERLHDLRHDGALQHVLEGEASFTRTRAKHSLAQVPYPLVASVSEHRPYWYSVRPQVPGCVVLPCIIHRHHAVAWNPDGLLVSNNFFHGEPVGDVDPLVLLAILNSRFVALMMEVFGRPKGMGALNLYGPDLARLPVPDLRQFPAELSARLRNAFLRRIESTEPSDPASTAFTEDPVNEWTEDALGLGPAMRQVVRAALTERLELRLARGRTRSG